MFTVQKGVPMPAASEPGRPTKYPFSTMVAGDSFTVPVPAGETARQTCDRVRAASTSWIKRHGNADGGLRFVVRAVREKTPTPSTVEFGPERDVVRVWAVART